jgi:hypothetical protein
MDRRTFEEGYREGWLSVAGEQPLPETTTEPPPTEARDYQAGFLYGRSDALERYIPGSAEGPPEPTDS